MPDLSLETLRVLDEILSGITLNVGAPGFEEKAVAIARAKRELKAALDAEQAPAN